MAMKKNRLGMWTGVYIPCVLAIFGVILFDRMSWICGEAGLFLACLILFLGLLSAKRSVLTSYNAV